MPQSVIDAVHQVGAPSRGRLKPLVVVEFDEDRRAEVYRALAAAPVRVLAIEEAPAMR